MSPHPKWHLDWHSSDRQSTYTTVTTVLILVLSSLTETTTVTTVLMTMVKSLTGTGDLFVRRAVRGDSGPCWLCTPVPSATSLSSAQARSVVVQRPPPV